VASSNNGTTRIVTGQFGFDGGVDSSRVPTIASELIPNGLKPNQLAWANNITIRTAGISPRPGWHYLTTLPTGLYQGGWMYEPRFAFPYPIMAIAGQIYRVRVDTDNSVENITGATGGLIPNAEQTWWTQGEEFAVIQDSVTTPLIWDGNVLQLVTSMGGTPPYIVPSEPMDYYMGRVWLARGREYVAGDMVGGMSGTAAYNFRDSILHMVENTYTSGGGAFIVPSNAGNIRALNHPSNINTDLGEGQLLPFTRKVIYSVNVVPLRSEWINLKEPIQRVALQNFGTTSDRSVISINGDLYYQSIDGVRSFKQAIRDFEAPGNTPISEEVLRAVRANDRSLLRFGTGVEFDNRLLQSCLPFQSPYGVAHSGILPLNFELINSLSERLPPAWEGIWEGLNIFQLFSGDFGGRQRTFGVVHNTRTNNLELWELDPQFMEDEGPEGENRITWSFETPSFTWGDPFALKRLETLELWVDQLRGKVEFKVEYRPDAFPCWIYWHYWTECSARDNCETETAPPVCDYPIQEYCPSYKIPMVLPKAPAQCNESNSRPSDIGFSFQLRISIKGNCRVRGYVLHATPKDKALQDGLRCNIT
jgi:hypothetical protein